MHQNLAVSWSLVDGNFRTLLPGSKKDGKRKNSISYHGSVLIGFYFSHLNSNWHIRFCTNSLQNELFMYFKDCLNLIIKCIIVLNVK